MATLPAAPDAALIAVDRHRTIEVVRQLRKLGCGEVVCYASGFGEVGVYGAALQDGLRAAAGAMPLLGPNCHGYVNALSGAALWPDVQGCRRVDRGVAVITQSGNLGLTLSVRAGDRSPRWSPSTYLWGDRAGHRAGVHCGAASARGRRPARRRLPLRRA